MLRRIKKVLLMVNHSVLMLCAGEIALLFLNKYIHVSLHTLIYTYIVAVISYLIAANVSGVYRQITRFVGFNEIVLIMLSEALSFLTVVMVTTILGMHNSYRLIMLTFLLSLLLIPASRFCWRLFIEFNEQRKHLKYKISTKSKKALVLGAGRGGNSLLSQIKIDKSNINVIGIIDDDKAKIGMKVQGKKVLGTTKNIKKIIKENG